MSFAKKVRQSIDEIKEHEKKFWGKFVKNSFEYIRILELNNEDLETLERGQGRGSLYPDIEEIGEKGFLKVTVGGEQFALSVKHVCAHSYGAGWEKCIVAICISNLDINESIGYGTALISVVSGEWQHRLATYLRDNEDSLKLVR